MAFRKLAFLLSATLISTSSWASLGGSQDFSENVTPEEQARVATVNQAANEGDFLKFLDNALPSEIEQLIGQDPGDYAERISPGTQYNFIHRFVVDLNYNRTGQRMYWFKNGQLMQRLTISGARAGYNTPRGVFKVHNAMVMAHSAKYENSPMPCAFFFNHGGGYAIHGTEEPRKLGRPASHGCVRTKTEVFCPIWHSIMNAGEEHSIAVEVVDSTDGIVGDDQIAAYDGANPVAVASASSGTVTKKKKKKKAVAPVAPAVKEAGPYVPDSGGLY
jgi:hypothetical protein